MKVRRRSEKSLIRGGYKAIATGHRNYKSATDPRPTTPTAVLREKDRGNSIRPWYQRTARIKKPAKVGLYRHGKTAINTAIQKWEKV